MTSLKAVVIYGVDLYFFILEMTGEKMHAHQRSLISKHLNNRFLKYNPWRHEAITWFMY